MKARYVQESAETVVAQYLHLNRSELAIAVRKFADSVMPVSYVVRSSRVQEIMDTLQAEDEREGACHHILPYAAGGAR